MRSIIPLSLARATLTVAAIVGALGSAATAADGDLALRLRSRVEDRAIPGRFALIEQSETWNPKETAVIVCDMWDLHHCLNAVRRGGELAPTMDRVLKTMRDRGATVIHAPSECMDAYADHPARNRAIAAPRSKNIPAGIGEWCKQIPSEERGAYPIDQTDGGEDDDLTEHAEWAAKLAKMGRNPKAPWKSQTEMLTIDEAKDYISVGGEEIWSILEQRGIKNVVLMGVHLNMCVLGRPFGLRQMAKNGRKVVLVRDMTDTMYNPAMPPKVNHFAGTDLMVEHVEKYVAPTITSDQILGGSPFVFKGDKRPHVAMLIAEDEYRTEVSLPAFASKSLIDGYRVSFVMGDAKDKNALGDVSALDSADLAVISVRRRVLPKAQVALIRKFVAAGKPIVGIRTASHAFSPRGTDPIPEGREAWAGFDPEVLGGHYHGHHGETPKVEIGIAGGASPHPILEGVDAAKIVGHGSLYKVSPLAKTATPLLTGSIPGGDSEPVAWTNATTAKGRVFYTSLGQIDDFANPDFVRMLRNAIDWAARRTP